jgi:hypothetical protein
VLINEDEFFSGLIKDYGFGVDVKGQILDNLKIKVSNASFEYHSCKDFENFINKSKEDGVDSNIFLLSFFKNVCSCIKKSKGWDDFKGKIDVSSVSLERKSEITSFLIKQIIGV